MERVLVIGSGGAGKTTVARAVAEATGLPLIHLDEWFWRPGWERVPEEAWRAQARELAAWPRWVMDGNYGGTMAERLAAADAVVFLDLPPLLCLARLVRRRLRHRGRSRPSMPDGCPERLTHGFLWWVLTFRRRRRPGILRKLEEVATTKRVHVLTSQRAVDAFVDDLRRAQSAGGRAV